MKAQIASKQACFTLERLHAELGGKILESNKEAERLAQDMRHVEAVLKMLDPDYGVRSIAVRRRKPNQYFKRGTIFRSVLELLRDAQEPLTASEITLPVFWRRKAFLSPRERISEASLGACNRHCGTMTGKPYGQLTRRGLRNGC